MVRFGFEDSDSEDDSDFIPPAIPPPDLAESLSLIPPVIDIIPPPVLPPPSRNNTLAIGIYMHGAILTNKKGKPVINNNFPEGVHITKKNQGGGFGDYTYSIYKNEHLKPDTANYAYNRTFYNVLREFETCVDKQFYDKHINHWSTIKQIPSELCQQDSCEVFDGLTKYYEKIYAASDGTDTLQFPAIMFMIEVETDKIIQNFGTYYYAIERRDINIVNCTETALFDFFRIKGKHDIDTERLLEHHCNEFVQQRYEIFTSDIFNLIQLAADFLDVKKVNILDESCNVIGAEEGCTGPTSKCKNFKLGMVRDPDIGYGGRHKLKRKSKSKRILKRKSKRKLP